MSLHNVLPLMGYYIPSSKNFINILKTFFLLLYINSGEENINIGCLSNQLQIFIQTSLNLKAAQSLKSHLLTK